MKICRTAAPVQIAWMIAIFVVGIALATLPSSAQDKADKHDKASGKSIGFILSADASEHDLGLPIYPGAQRYKENEGDTPALHMGLWGGDSGFKLVVLKLESSDSPAKIAKYYHKRLAHYGTVVDCAKFISGESKDNVNCENDHPVPGGYTLEAGTKEKMHVVGIEPKGQGSLISLVYVESPKSEADKD